MTSEYHKMCAELLEELQHWDYPQALKDQARAALARWGSPAIESGPQQEEN